MCLSASAGSWACAVKYAVPIREWRLKVPVTISRNDSFYDALSTATGNSYDYGGNSRRYENTVARDGCTARVEKSLSRDARLPRENVNICFYGEKKGRTRCRERTDFHKAAVVLRAIPKRDSKRIFIANLRIIPSYFFIF